MRAKRKPVLRMTNWELLEEYRSLMSWFGDDFSLSTPTRHDEARAGKLEQEILARMGRN